MYKTLWNHLAQNKKKAPAPAVFLALLTAGWSAKSFTSEESSSFYSLNTFRESYIF